MKNISLEVSDCGIGIATMDMPGRPFNVFSEEMMADLEILIEKAEAELKGLILCSGKKAFVVGADLAMIEDFANMRFEADWQTMRDRFSYLGKLFRRLEQLPIPVVAAINGLALGGGLELAMACHARVCTDVTTPLLGLPEVLLSLLPGAGGTQRLPRYVGLETSMNMLLGGESITAARALEIGLVDEVVAESDLLTAAIARIKTTVPKAHWDQEGSVLSDVDQALMASTQWTEYCREVSGWDKLPHQLYPAVEAIVRCVGQGAGLSIDEGCNVEWDIFVDLMCNPVAANMVLTCFLNRTAAPKWTLEQVAAGAPALESVAWLSSQTMPGSLGNKAQVVSESQAKLLIVDEMSVRNKPFIQLHNVLEANVPEALSSARISYVGNLNTAEIVEVSAAPELSRAVVDAALAMGKTPLWPVAEGGGMSMILSVLQDTLGNSDKDAPELSRAARAVDAAGLFSLAVGIDAADGARLTGADKNAGLNLLGEMAVAILLRTSGHHQAVDVLAVFALGWPKWTGGPMAFLAMLQRKEVKMEGFTDELLSAVASIDRCLKNKASYNSALVS